MEQTLTFTSAVLGGLSIAFAANFLHIMLWIAKARMKMSYQVIQ